MRGADRTKEERDAATAKYQEIFRSRLGITEQLAGIKELHSLDAERAKYWEKMDANSKKVAENTSVIYANFKEMLTILQGKTFDPETSPFPAFIKTVRDLTQDLLNLLTDAPEKMKENWANFWKDAGRLAAGAAPITNPMSIPIDWLLRKGLQPTRQEDRRRHRRHR
jgi:hypothetical protein